MVVFFRAKQIKVLIFGAGSAARAFYQKQAQQYNVIGFVDNASFKKDSRIFGKVIYSPNQLKQLEFDKVIIASMYHIEIKQQLIEDLCIPEYKIGVFTIDDSSGKKNPNVFGMFNGFGDMVLGYVENLVCNQKYFRHGLYSLFKREGERLVEINWLDTCVSNKLISLREVTEDVIHAPHLLGSPQASHSVVVPEVALFGFNDVKVGSASRSLYLEKELRVVMERVPSAIKYTNRVDYSCSLIRYHGTESAILSPRLSLPGNSFIERGIVILGIAETNYFHFIIEVVSKLQFIKELPEQYREYPIILSEYAGKITSIKQIISYFDITHPLLFLKTGEIYNIGSALVINSPNLFVPSFKRGGYPVLGGVYRQESLLYLRDLVLKNIPGHTKNLPSKVFFARKGHIRTYNQPEIIRLLEEYGVTSVYMEDFSFDEQVSLMQNAQIIIGPSGAAWTNILFAQPTAKALCWGSEINSELACFSDIAKRVGVQLDYLTYKTNSRATRDSYFASYIMNVALVENWLLECNLERTKQSLEVEV